MKHIILIMAFFSFINTVRGQSSEHITIVGFNTFQKAVAQENVQIVDVRTPEEFEEGTIGKAVNIDFFDKENFKSEFLKFDKTKPIYIFCRSGNRSQKAAHRLVDMGFENVIDLEGGYLNWVAKEE
ncbi:rhodanese-like domain-containing protein [Nonlabens spongiae]|nr:rhodanese-like domain-containing protein [Nonlabens spongiae]